MTVTSHALQLILVFVIGMMCGATIFGVLWTWQPSPAPYPKVFKAVRDAHPVMVAAALGGEPVEPDQPADFPEPPPCARPASAGTVYRSAVPRD